MDWIAWLSLAGICTLGAMSPGPSLLIVMRNAASGVRQGLAAAVAHGIAIAVYAGLTAFGLAVLITSSPAVFAALQWAGAALLLYLGWKSLRATGSGSGTAEKPRAPVPVHRAALQGFGVAFFNPKVVIFFTALFSQFVTEQQSFTVKLGMAALASAIDAAWYCLVAIAVTTGSRGAWISESVSRRLQQLLGILLVALAARLVLSI
ncbi:LysE family translocator [Microbulbifer sp. 2201CG32-9]|uniref:LysE family translocator n=1 Tax=Microbulbifer sp. 2201CG32-9 TaxID=3232309 RepID=UPI00345B6156